MKQTMIQIRMRWKSATSSDEVADSMMAKKK
jgi:hypothetical protein